MLFQEGADVVLYAPVERGFGIGGMLAEHVADGSRRVLVGRQFVLHLQGMLGQAVNLALTLAPQPVSYTHLTLPTIYSV